MNGNTTEGIVVKLMQAEKAPGDYAGADGLLYCGKCRTPKQVRLDYNPATGEKVETLAAIACKCQREAYEAAEQREKREQFKRHMDRCREDGISAPNGLNWTFEQDEPTQPKVSDTCRRYVERWEEVRAENIGVLLYGAVGAGKSFYASCIGNALLDKGVPAAATNFPRLLNLLQGTQEKQKLLDRLSKYKLLILDDLGVERDSAYGTEQIFNIIDARCSSKLPVVVTTNLTLEELEHPVSMQYARIYDRVLEMCPVRVRLTGESRRKGNAEARRELARRILLG